MLRTFAVCLALVGSPHIAAAQQAPQVTIEQSIISQLEAQGFSRMTVSRTWLGRVRIISFRDDLRREIVFDPRTGEILRDFWEEITADDEDDGGSTPRIFNPGNGGSGGDDDDDDDRDEDDDDDDDDDEDDDDDDDDDEDDDDE